MNRNHLVKCQCGFVIFENNVLKSRLVRFESDHAVAKCKRCKRDVDLPQVRVVASSEK